MLTCILLDNKDSELTENPVSLQLSTTNLRTACSILGGKAAWAWCYIYSIII